MKISRIVIHRNLLATFFSTLSSVSINFTIITIIIFSLIDHPAASPPFVFSATSLPLTSGGGRWSRTWAERWSPYIIMADHNSPILNGSLRSELPAWPLTSPPPSLSLAFTYLYAVMTGAAVRPLMWTECVCIVVQRPGCEARQNK